jgi:hypothetical protein
MFLPLAALSFDTIGNLFREAVVIADIVRWRAVTVVAWHIGTRQLHGSNSKTAMGRGGGGRDAIDVFDALNKSTAVWHVFSVSITDTVWKQRLFKVCDVFWVRDIGVVGRQEAL